MIGKFIRKKLKYVYDTLLVNEAHNTLIDHMEHNTPLDDDVLDQLHKWGYEDEDLENAVHILIDVCTAIMAVDYDFRH